MSVNEKYLLDSGLQSEVIEKDLAGKFSQKWLGDYLHMERYFKF